MHHESASSVLSNSDENRKLKRSNTLPSDAGTLNYLEDMALTQSMFENGTLICHGEAEAFVNIIRNSRRSFQDMGSEEVK